MTDRIPPWSAQETDEEGRDFIKAEEQCRLKVYPDVGGHMTVGYGHRTALKEGTEISQQKANQLLLQDIRVAEKCIVNNVTVELTQHEFNALTSFIFNVGCTAFVGSRLLQHLNDGHHSEVPAELRKWVYVRHHRVDGLIKRRNHEAALWQKSS